MKNNLQSNNLILYSRIILALGLIFLFFIPDDYIYKSNSLCIHKKILGFDCPGCGITRALHALLNLEFQTAFNYNFSVFALFPLILIEIIILHKSYSLLFNIKKYIYQILCFLLFIIYFIRISKKFF
jgi:hypothetical protein